MTHNTSDNHSGGEWDWEKRFEEELYAENGWFKELGNGEEDWSAVKDFIRTEKSKSYQEGVAAENNKLAALVGTALHGIELDAMTLHKLNMLFTPTNTV